MLDSPTIQILLATLAPGGIAGLAVKLVLNGTRERVKAIDDRTLNTQKAVEALHARVDAIELNAADERGYDRARREIEDKG